MKINETPHLDLHPHKASKPTDLPTIAEIDSVDFGNRTRVEMRRTWMRQANMVGEGRSFFISNIEAQSKFNSLVTGFSMLREINKGVNH